MDSQQDLFQAFIYGANLGRERTQLWQDFLRASANYKSVQWVASGDFNVVRTTLEASGGISGLTNYYMEFNDFILQAELDDLRSTGCLFTLNNKRIGTNNIARRLDRVLVNEHWLRAFQDSVACS